ncbi:MAG: efflux RND transporter periplasmic adaptor subunit [Deltaproteobacteria bacterium]|nr:efflux RND transporter periplasmic adaptor subunit [Deltaproteobacteria bacterium]
MPLRDKFIKIGLPLLILLIGFALMRGLISSRKAPAKKEYINPGVLAEVVTVHPGKRRIRIAGNGTVQARREVSIIPQVGGRVVWKSPKLLPGGFFRKGELLFRIEKVDYRLAVDRARAALAQAELDLAREESNARVARSEWTKMDLAAKAKPTPLILHEPQLRQARATVTAAKAGLKQAELDLSRTRITAPFNCRVRSEEVDVGQVVRLGEKVGLLAGTDEAEIVVPLPREGLRWLSIPGPGSKAPGSKAVIRFSEGKDLLSLVGRIVRSLGEVDPEGRMARVVIAVNDPYHLKAPTGNVAADLLLGMFVDVTMEGRTLSKVFVLPRKALRDQGTVWLAGQGDQLTIRKVDVVRKEREKVMIDRGLQDGDRVVLTALSGVVEGMKLRLRETGVAP